MHPRQGLRLQASALLLEKLASSATVCGTDHDQTGSRKAFFAIRNPDSPTFWQGLRPNGFQVILLRGPRLL